MFVFVAKTRFLFAFSCQNDGNNQICNNLRFPPSESLYSFDLVRGYFGLPSNLETEERNATYLCPVSF